VPEENASPPSFESSLDELEQVVRELEAGNLPLEQSLALFEKGVMLSERCRKQLEEAETRVEMLVRRGNRVVAEPFALEGERPEE
jgi:exodeoxyribonuclease VII small subunit